MRRTGPILRMFEVYTKPGCADTLLEKFAVTSAEVVKGEPGNLGYYFGRAIDGDSEVVTFVSVWDDLSAIQTKFGEAWLESYLPAGYDELIESCSLRHIDVDGGWHVSERV